MAAEVYLIGLNGLKTEQWHMIWITHIGIFLRELEYYKWFYGNMYVSRLYQSALCIKKALLAKCIDHDDITSC